MSSFLTVFSIVVLAIAAVMVVNYYIGEEEDEE